MVQGPDSIYQDFTWCRIFYTENNAWWAHEIHDSRGCLLSKAVKQKLNDAACTQFYSTLLIDFSWQEHSVEYEMKVQRGRSLTY